MKKTAIMICMSLMACNGFKTIQSVFSDSPYEKYINSLNKAGLYQKPMTTEWEHAGLRVFNDSVLVNLPFSETGYFQAAYPDARSYRFNVRRGQIITIEGRWKAKSRAQIFMDLFIWKDNKWKLVAYGDSAMTLTYEPKQNSTCLLRMQPELLVNVYYSITIGLTPVLVNPVSGAVNRSIGSFYGADRNGGARSHEGIDIFAPRGTPVIAPTDGVISRVGHNSLGGKVIWMYDLKRDHRYYFAHLEGFNTSTGTRVKQGDTIGYVGTSGNAQGTRPHLHFGIYQSRSIDPIHYVKTMETVAGISPDTAFNPIVFRVNTENLNMRSGPATKSEVIGKLQKEEYVRVIGKTGDWYRIALANNKQGFVYQSLVKEAQSGEPLNIEEETPLLAESTSDAIPINHLGEKDLIEILAKYNSYLYVKTEEGQEGWIKN